MRPENAEDAEEAEDIAKYKEMKAREKKEKYKRGLIGKESPLTFKSQIREMAHEVAALKIDPDDIHGEWEKGYSQAIRDVVHKLDRWENSK